MLVIDKQQVQDLGLWRIIKSRKPPTKNIPDRNFQIETLNFDANNCYVIVNLS